MEPVEPEEQSRCSAPPPPADLALIAALDHEADPAVLHHIALCPSCAARFTELFDAHQRLRTIFYRAFCPSSDALRDYLVGLLPVPEPARIAEHLAICPHCRAELALLRDGEPQPPKPRGAGAHLRSRPAF